MARAAKQTAHPSRLDKVLGAAGVGSRKEIRQLVRAGRVVVNEQPAQDPGEKVFLTDRISVDGQVIPMGPTTLMLNKPTGVITARKDASHPTVFDLLPPVMADRLFPAGRLDKESEGLLIITDDGKLCHRLISPRYGIEKEYLVKVDGAIQSDLIEEFSLGVLLRDGTKTAPAELKVLKSDPPGQAMLTIREGKYHQVRRMFGWAGLHVISLKRVRVGALALPDNLAPGEYRHLRQEEVALLLTP